MNVVERRARKLKKQEEYMARLKAADELNRKKAGVLPKEEAPVVEPQEEEISYSVQSIEAVIVPPKTAPEETEPGEVDMFVTVVVNEKRPAEAIEFDVALSGSAVVAEEAIILEAPTEPVEAPEALEKEDEQAKPEEVTSDLLDEPVVQPKKRGKKKKN